MESILNYIKFDENISTSGQPTAQEFQSIAKNGFDVVINLARHDSDDALENEDKIVANNQMSYIHIPVSWENPEKEKLKLFFTILHSLHKERKKVFIHCAKNYRVSVFMYLYQKIILGRKDAKLIAPKEFVPDKSWEDFISYQ